MPSGGNETYIGSVKSPGDAIKLFEACRLGLLPRIQRRLSEKERQDIKSGSVFVWDEKEAGMRRWTDGKSWSASRVVGSFLQYREMEGKRGTAGFGTSRRSTGRLAEAGQPSDEEQEAGQETYRYKAGGLVKQSFSITTSTGQHLHLIAYYVQQPPGAPEMQQPSTDPALRHITPIRGMYPESSIHEAASSPAVTRMPINPYVGPPAHPDPGAYGNHYAPPAWTAREPSPVASIAETHAAPCICTA
ncbi:hypothetical protein NPX13_g6878 [Xylaria arbuscula]|uniref:Camp independent regulatory protein n=1 Tax=Xylaria arbuscula TaxID=114810 RepID=A0A9W8NB20_9PEZI|nr:hypothetical protein NPX13_g6878 [Xylaria arbuscula]